VLEAVTKQRSEERDWEHQSLCDSDLWSVLKCPVNPTTDPKPVYTQSRDNSIYVYKIMWLQTISDMVMTFIIFKLLIDKTFCWAW
jgi:hypothetical protein